MTYCELCVDFGVMSTARKSHPSDVSNAEWEFLIPYLTLMRESGVANPPLHHRQRLATIDTAFRRPSVAIETTKVRSPRPGAETCRDEVLVQVFFGFAMSRHFVELPTLFEEPIPVALLPQF